MADKTTIKIFIASSSELKEERDKSVHVITQLNKSHKHLHLVPVLWEYDMVQSSFPHNKNIQDAINPEYKSFDIGKFSIESPNYTLTGRDSNFLRQFDSALIR